MQGLRARIEAENVPFTRTASSNLGQRSRMLRTGVHFKRHVRTVDSRPGSRSLNGERCDAHQLVACSILRNAGALRALIIRRPTLLAANKAPVVETSLKGSHCCLPGRQCRQAELLIFQKNRNEGKTTYKIRCLIPLSEVSDIEYSFPRIKNSGSGCIQKVEHRRKTNHCYTKRSKPYEYTR